MIQDSNKAALIVNNKEVSYHQLLQKAYQFAEPLDVVANDIVLVFSKPRVGYIYALYALWSKKAIYNTWFHNLNAKTLCAAIDEITPKAIYTSEIHLHIVNEALEMSQCQPQVLLIDDYEDKPIDEHSPVAQLKYSFEDVAFVVYTAGITNKHKPVILTFANIISNVESMINAGYYNSNDRVLVMLPFYNTWILIGTVIIPLYAEATCVISDSLVAEYVMKIVKDNKVTIFIGVKKIYNEMLDIIMNKINKYAYSRLLYKMAERVNFIWFSKLCFRWVHQEFGGSLRYFLTIGTKVDKTICQRFIALGFDILEGYGMAEASSIITYPISKRTHIDSVGKLIDGIQIKIINNELVLRGPNFTNEFYHRPHTTKEIINNGWFFTGDAGWMDKDGFIYISGRMDENLILPDGHVINPVEMDNRLSQFEDYIEEAGVYFNNGVLKAIIVPNKDLVQKMGRDNNYEKLQVYLRWNVVEHCNHAVPPFKRIKQIAIIEKILPRSTSGKLKRYLLSDFEIKEKDEFVDIEKMIQK